MEKHKMLIAVIDGLKDLEDRKTAQAIDRKLKNKSFYDREIKKNGFYDFLDDKAKLVRGSDYSMIKVDESDNLVHFKYYAVYEGLHKDTGKPIFGTASCEGEATLSSLNFDWFGEHIGSYDSKIKALKAINDFEYFDRKNGFKFSP